MLGKEFREAKAEDRRRWRRNVTSRPLPSKEAGAGSWRASLEVGGPSPPEADKPRVEATVKSDAHDELREGENPEGFCKCRKGPLRDSVERREPRDPPGSRSRFSTESLFRVDTVRAWAKLSRVTAKGVLSRILLFPYQLFVVVNFFLLLLVCVPAVFFAGVRDPRGDRAHRCLRIWARANLRLAGLRVRIEGLERLDPEATYIFMFNHASFLDILLTLAHIPYKFRIITKDEMFRVPLMGWMLRRSGQIPMNRANPRKGLMSLKRASLLVQDGISVVVFPEGTRTKNGEINDFKATVFILPIRSGAAVVPVLIEGTFAALRRGSIWLQNVPLTMTFHAPIPPGRFTEHDRLLYARKVREVLASSLAPRAASSVPS